MWKPHNSPWDVRTLLKGGRHGGQKHGRPLTKEKPQHKSVHGFLNLGNSCYMNSAIQCLLATKPLVEYFEKCDYRKDINTRNKSKGMIAHAFAQLVKDTRSNSKEIMSLRTLKKTLSASNSTFNGTDPHDAQEFLMVFLDTIHEEMNKGNNSSSKKVPQEPDVDRQMVKSKTAARLSSEAWQRYLQRNRSLVVHLFQGQIQSRVLCMRCNDFLSKFEPFMYLSLTTNVSQSNSSSSTYPECTLEHLLEAYEAPEILEEPCWYCPKCRMKVPVVKTIRIVKLPLILMIHYKPDGGQQVEAPLTDLDLSPFVDRDDEQPFYDLYGVLDYSGNTNPGHYTASCKYNETWFRLDDTDIYSIPENQVINRRNYMLFYESQILKHQSLVNGENWIDPEYYELVETISSMSIKDQP